MHPLPITAWSAALEAMSGAIDQALTDLDRRQADRGSPDESARASEPMLASLEGRLGQWDAQLTAAANLTGAVEAEFQEREMDVKRWQEVFARWRQMIEQKAEL